MKSYNFETVNDIIRLLFQNIYRKINGFEERNELDQISLTYEEILLISTENQFVELELFSTYLFIFHLFRINKKEEFIQMFISFYELFEDNMDVVIEYSKILFKPNLLNNY